MNVQEQIEKAWKAGFEEAMANAYSESGDNTSSIWSLEKHGFEEALDKYINTQALAAAESDGNQ